MFGAVAWLGVATAGMCVVIMLLYCKSVLASAMSGECRRAPRACTGACAFCTSPGHIPACRPRFVRYFSPDHFLHSLHSWGCRLWSKMLAPPHSLHSLGSRLCPHMVLPPHSLLALVMATVTTHISTATPHRISAVSPDLLLSGMEGSDADCNHRIRMESGASPSHCDRVPLLVVLSAMRGPTREQVYKGIQPWSEPSSWWHCWRCRDPRGMAQRKALRCAEQRATSPSWSDGVRLIIRTPGAVSMGAMNTQR